MQRAVRATGCGLALTALLAISASAIATPAAAATAETTFAGSCQLTGGLLTPVAGSGNSGPTVIDFIATSGSCTGSLNGQPSATYAATGGWESRGLFVPDLGLGLPTDLLPVAATGIGGIQFADGSQLAFAVTELVSTVSLRGVAGGHAAGLLIGGGTNQLTLRITTTSTLRSG